MGDLLPPLVFKKDLAFYDMVSSFMVAVSGSPAIFRPDNPMKFEPEQTIELTGVVHRSVSIKPYQIHRNALDGFISSDLFKYSLCMMLANTAYEAVKECNDQSPEFEFFRHIRNASSHNNHFNFKTHEPSRAAAWRELQIDHTRKGRSNPLHGQVCFGHFIGISDLLLLLWDIEQIIVRSK